MSRIFILVVIWLNCGLQAGALQAQLRGFAAPPAGREPARVGLLGGLRDARDERFRREEQAATAVARAAAAAAAQRNAVANPNAAASSAAARSAAKQPLSNAANSPTLRRESNPQSVEAARAASNSRTANYGSPNLRPGSVISAPSWKTWPALGSTRRLMQRSSVDLPAPLGPRITRNSPARTSMLMLLSAGALAPG